MFTGIITHTGTVTDATQKNDLRVRIACDFAGDLSLGESVAVDGCCLTVVEQTRDAFSADLSDETVKRTTPRWKKGNKVNLERSLKLGDALDGHMVTGHVDGIVTLTSIKESGGSHILTIEAPKELSRFVAEKGSVTLDGISLTVNQVDGNRFSVNIIPHTWQHTTLNSRKAGDALNIEIDIMARYAARLMAS